MVGGGKTHSYPYGRPFPLLLLDIAMAVLLVTWVFLVPGHWTRAIGIIATFLVMLFISAKLHTRYEQSGIAVPIPRSRVVVKFLHGLPSPMLMARISFFMTVAVMVLFGVVSFATS